MTPTSLAAQESDRAALIRLFTEFGNTHNCDMIVKFATQHDLKQLLALGWIKPAPGRWSAGRYAAGPNLFPDESNASSEAAAA